MPEKPVSVDRGIAGLMEKVESGWVISDARGNKSLLRILANKHIKIGSSFGKDVYGSDLGRVAKPQEQCVLILKRRFRGRVEDGWAYLVYAANYSENDGKVAFDIPLQIFGWVDAKMFEKAGR